MRRARAILIAILLVGTAVTATAGDMVLTRNGELYSVAPTDEGLVVNHRFTDGTTDEYLIPQTSGVAATSLQVGVDELTGAMAPSLCVEVSRKVPEKVAAVPKKVSLNLQASCLAIFF